ncbi:hypothetical protein AQUCO_04100173v1 [Aquilegia coerulea]|uniref:Uncharacterized protein n=1 Tax=Aquilegia coerulea TaxID=218851 RepID=A0A2G5CQG5_AQUCA|nr:hypothetical protein AQUCO_04100173v1 [Aquilegia coerulea]
MHGITSEVSTLVVFLCWDFHVLVSSTLVEQLLFFFFSLSIKRNLIKKKKKKFFQKQIVGLVEQKRHDTFFFSQIESFFLFPFWGHMLIFDSEIPMITLQGFKNFTHSFYKESTSISQAEEVSLLNACNIHHIM